MSSRSLPKPGPSGPPPIFGWSCLEDRRKYNCPSPKPGPSGPPSVSRQPWRGFRRGGKVGRGLGGRERGTGSCGLPTVPTRSQPNGRYRLTPRAKPAHGWPSLLLTRPGKVHRRHRPSPYAPMASGRGRNSRTDWGRARARPRPPSSDLLDHGCSSHGTSHFRHQPLLPTDPTILVLVLDHYSWIACQLDIGTSLGRRRN